MAGQRAGTAGSRLERSIQAFRERDWAGIAIEVAVVTLGVLLAFQIDQWAQDRRQAREERQFLERMWRETDEAIRENDWVISLHAVNRRALMQALALRSDPQALAHYRLGGCGADSLPGLGFNDTSYEELGNSGRLNIVSDPQLRMQLRRVMAAQADAVAQLNYSRQRGTRIRQALEPYLRLDVDRDGKRSCTTNWHALVKDPLAVNAVVLAERNHVLMWWKRAYTRDCSPRRIIALPAGWARQTALTVSRRLSGAGISRTSFRRHSRPSSTRPPTCGLTSPNRLPSETN